MTAKIIDLSSHIDAGAIEASAQCWGQAIGSLSSPRKPLQAVARAVLADIDGFRKKALPGRHCALILPIVQLDESGSVEVGLAINAFGVERQIYQALRFTYATPREHLPARPRAPEIASYIDGMLAERYEFSITGAISALTRIPLMAFGHHHDGRVVEGQGSTSGWRVLQFAPYPTPGRCVEMTTEYDAKPLQELDRVIARLDPSRR